MNLLKSVIALVSAVFLGGAAGAQITAIGPFTGNGGTEGFETQTSSSGAGCAQGRIFSNRGDVCSNALLVSGGWSFSCQIQPYAGGRFAGSASGITVYNFDECVTRFGGYLGNNTTNGVNGVASFYDSTGALVASMPYTLPNDCTWYWSGWDFGGIPIQKIELALNNYGGFTMMDNMEADFGSCSGGSGVQLCFGDGTGFTCPCGNLGGTDKGCANSMTNGASMTATGQASVSSDTLVLNVANSVPNTNGIFFCGTSRINAGSGAPFGDGLMCAGGHLVRLEISGTNAAGDLASSINIHLRYGSIPGDTKVYQYWYNDPGGVPCGTGFNTSGAVEVIWGL